MMVAETLTYDNAPAVLLFADDPQRRDAVAEEIEAAGGRIVVAADLAGASARIGEQWSLEAVVIDVAGDGGFDIDEAERLFDVVQAGAEAQRHGSVVNVPRELLDMAAARLGHIDVELMVEPTLPERIGGIARAMAPRRLRASDVGSGQAAMPQLRELSEEVGRIARTLASLSQGAAAERASAAPRVDPIGLSPLRQGDALIDGALVRAMIRARRLREQYFPAELFADPAWDMLLDLTAARLERRPVAVSSLCIASAVPPTTALRWIKTLTDHGLFVRIADPDDKRRVFIELSEAAAEGMLDYLAACRRVTALPV